MLNYGIISNFINLELLPASIYNFKVSYKNNKNINNNLIKLYNNKIEADYNIDIIYNIIIIFINSIFSFYFPILIFKDEAFEILINDKPENVFEIILRTLSAQKGSILLRDIESWSFSKILHFINTVSNIHKKDNKDG